MFSSRFKRLKSCWRSNCRN